MKSITSALAALAVLSLPLVVACGADDDPNNNSGGSAGTGGSGTGGDTTNVGGGPGSGGSGAAGATGGAPAFEGFTQVDQSGNAQSGSADMVVAPDGTIYVTWVRGTENDDDVVVAQSTDGGQTFGSPITLDDGAINPLVSKARHPWIAADNDRVAVAFNDQDGNIHLFVSDAGSTLDFGDYNAIGTDITTTFRDFPVPVFLPDGTVAVGFQAYPTSGNRIFFSRESAGFTTEVASTGAPGVPCDCCPLEVAVDSEGNIIAAFRNDDNDDREFWVAVAPDAGAFSSWAQASTTEGQINQCPMEGPRIAQLSATEHALVYSTRGPNNTGAVVISFTSDGGATWTGGAPIDGFSGDEPTVARGPSGRLYVTAMTGNGRSSLVYSDDDGATWSNPAPIQSDDGDIAVPQPSAAGGIAALAGVSDGNNVWFSRME